MGRLDGKVALVSGGASGIGAAHVRLFAREGAKVVSGDIQEDLGARVAAEANDAGGQVTFVRLDVTSADSWAAAVASAVSRFGALTTLVNNAGIYHPGGVTEETDEGWQRMIAINQTGVWYGMRAAMPELAKSGNGAVVNISSLYGMVGSPGSLSYHATKAAVRLMSKSAALEFVQQGVRVNTILPGQIRTPILGDLTPEMDAAIKAAIPMGRMGDPEDIAYGSVYLCSDEAKYVTGAELVIDAGWSIP
jgi:NAD(P)-dependent dehydrogenase (short-subunit alcohol dehydrogenase family)